MFGDPVSNPKGWEKVKLKKLLENVPKIGKDYNSPNIEYVDISSINNLKFIITSTTNYLLDDRPSRAQQILKNGDILLSTVRPNLKNIAINNVNGYIASTGFYVCSCSNRINNKFLFEVLKSDSVTNYFVGITAGANYPAIKSSDVSEFLISLPPISLQNQFAERVQVIEQQKAIAQQSLEKSEALFNSLLQKAFKGELV
jgi:restriction endonuclease S subunit